MFKKLKDKLTEEMKSSPQRLQQFTQSVSERLQNSTASDENFFSIGDDDANVSGNSSTLEPGFSSVSLYASPSENINRSRRLSNSSMASDVSFLTRYEGSSNPYHLQSDLDISASEIEDNASSTSQLGHLTKEQIYSAFQKAQMRYHKYRGRYTDLAKHYKDLERDNAKMKSVLVENQDRAIRRVNELKEQCALEQKAKAHLEVALRDEIDEKQFKIQTLETKIALLQNQNDSDKETPLIDVKTNENPENLEELTRFLNDARKEIETLNVKIQEMKANSIVFQSKEQEYKNRILLLEKDISEFAEREKENNLKLAQSKMELHNEIINKDGEIAQLKRNNEVLRQNLESLENEGKNSKLEQLQAQNKKLIDKIDSLTLRNNNLESELLKMEKYRLENEELHKNLVEIKNLQLENEEKLQNYQQQLSQIKNESEKEINDELSKLKIENVELLKFKTKNNELSEKITSLQNELEKALNNMENLSKEKTELLKSLSEQKECFEKDTSEIREEAKQSLLCLENKIKEKLSKEYEIKENNLREELRKKIESLSTESRSFKETQLKLVEKEEVIEKITLKLNEINEQFNLKQNKYNELELNHLELIEECAKVREDLAIKEKECCTLQSSLSELKNTILKLETENESFKENLLSANELLQKKQAEFVHLTNNNLELTQQLSKVEEQLRLLEERQESIEINDTECKLLEIKVKKLEEEKENILLEFEMERKMFNALNEEHKELQIKEKLLERLEQNVKTLEINLIEIQKTVQEKEMENVRLQELKLHLEQDLYMHKEKLRLLEEKCENIELEKSECKLLEMKLQKLEEEKNHIMQSFEQERKSFIIETENHSKNEKELREIKLKYEENIFKLEEAITDLKNETNINDKKIQNLTSLIEDKESQLVALQEKLDAELQNSQKIKKEFNLIKSEKEALNNEVMHLQNIEEDYKKLLNERKAEDESTSKIESEKMTLEEKLKVTISELEEYKGTNKQLLKDLENANEMSKSLKCEKQQILEEMLNFKTQLQQLIIEKANLEEKIKYNELNYNDTEILKSEISSLVDEKTKLQAEITELNLRLNQISSDNNHFIDENQKLMVDVEELKIKIDIVEKEKLEFNKIKEQLHEEKLQLSKEIDDVRRELNEIQEKYLETLNSSTSSKDIESIQNDFYEIKEKCDKLFSENKNLNSQCSSLESKCIELEGMKSKYEKQLSELEHQINEIVNENQLLKDEIQELKISPVNCQNSKLDNLAIIKQEKALVNLENDLKEISHNANVGTDDINEKYLKEIQSLREKLTQYKSLDITNKSSIEFYENELQKLKNKNEKLSRKLDETLVTLNHCTELSNSTEIEYLRNVLYNYMLGKESIVLARVIAAVCKFDQQQTETVLQREQQKQTLLGHLGII